MSIEITDGGSSVTVRYIHDNGGVATATVVGRDAESVREEAQKYVDMHRLTDKAEADG